MTTLTKEQWNTLLTEAKSAYETHNKHSDAWKRFFDTIFPGSYPPVIEDGYMDGFMKAVSIAYGERVAEDVAYFIYEVPHMKSPVTCVDKNGKEYDASDIEEYIHFVMS